MKKFSVILAILAVVLVFGLVFVGCETGSKATKFEGRWENLWSPNNLAFTFTGDTYSHTTNTGVINSGTFTFSNTTITFIPTSGSQWTQSYTLANNVLTLEQVPGHNFGPFTKQ